MNNKPVPTTPAVQSGWPTEAIQRLWAVQDAWSLEEVYTNDTPAGMMDRLTDDLRAILALLPSQGWRPIESAPKDGTIFWALFVHPNPRFRARAFEARYQTAPLLNTLLSNEENPRCHNLSANRWDTPTHWQPLPAPPLTEGETNEV